MKMAIAIQCHKNVEQLNRLIEFFRDDEIDIYIHVDKKSDIKQKIKMIKNLYILEESIDVRWGDFSIVESALKLFERIKESKIDYEYIHLISGQDYPIKKLEEFKRFFVDNNKQYVEYAKLPFNTLVRAGVDRYQVYYPRWMIDRPENMKKRIIRVAYRELILRTRIFKRKTDFIEDFYYGSAWFSITGDCMKFILSYIENNKKYIEFFKNSIYPDEMFFQTIIMNSKYSKSIVNNNLRYIDWSEKKASPKTLQYNDIDKALKSKSYFARKIDSVQLIDYIEDNL